MSSPAQQFSPSMHPRQLVSRLADVLWRHRSAMGRFFAGTMVLVVVGLVVCPREYESESKLFVRIGKENIGLDPTATTGQTMALQDSRENEITSLLDILDSRVVVERVVDRLGPRLILDGVAETNPDLSDQLLCEKAVRHFQSTLETSHTKKSNVVGISYRDRSPELAQQVLQAFIDEFQRVHIRANRTAGSFEFFDRQAELLRTQLEQASGQLNEAKDTINAASVEQRRTALQTHLSTVESNILLTQAELDSVVGSIESLDSTLASLPAKTLTQEVTGFPDDAIGTTRKRVYQLEIEEQQLLTRFTPRHPAVVDVQIQLQAAKTILNDRATYGSQATNADNPAYQQLNLKKLEQESHATGLRARLASLQGQFSQISDQLKDLNARETQIAELQQRVDLFGEKYATYSEKYEQARIDQALEAEKISNVNVVQPPSYVAKAVSPRKGLTLVAAFLFALVGAVCFAFLKEFWDAPLSGNGPPATADAAQVPVAATTDGVSGAVDNVEQLVESARY